VFQKQTGNKMATPPVLKLLSKPAKVRSKPKIYLMADKRRAASKQTLKPVKANRLRKQYFFLILRAQISRQKPSVLAAKRA
jgi:hypothetical protein